MGNYALRYDSDLAPTLASTAVIPVMNADPGGAAGFFGPVGESAGFTTLADLATFFAANSGPVVTTKVTINAAANAAALVASGYSLTGSDSTDLMDLTGTWNTSGTPTALKISITDTASGAAALLDVLGGSAGATSRFRVGKSGNTTVTGGGNTVALTVAGGTLTGSNTQGAIVVTNTWNTSGAPTAFSLAVTRTAADAASKIFDFLGGAGGATSLLSLTHTAATTGLLTVGGSGYGAAGASVRLDGLTSGAAAQTGTLANAPSAGNPTFWIPINIAGSIRYIPAWT